MATLPKGQGIIPLPPFEAWLANNIPAVYDNTMTYYEELCALLKYLQDTVVPAVNDNASAITVLSEYVEHYFDNLDVSAEVDRKLDEMAEDGTLAEMVASYLDANVAWTFNTVADMKAATNLISGSYARTLGFYAVGDGGGAMYYIDTTGTANEMNIIAIDDLRAHLVCNEANPLQFGAYGDNTHNDTAAIQACADYAQTYNLKFYVPPKTFVTDTVTIENVKIINIEGQFNLTANNQSLNIYENVNGATPDIFINKVTTGDIIMKGLNSATVTIQNAEKLRLIADNTTNHNFIAYTTFNLGFVRYLELEDDNSGTKWINENLFIGGRYLGVTIGAGSSGYSHSNNLFLEPMCEHTTWNFTKAYANRVVKARLEGTVTVNFSVDAMANTIDQDYEGTIQGYYNPSWINPGTITVNDASGGQNYVASNKNLFIEKKIIALNKFNNPKSVTVDGESLKPGKNVNIFTSNIVELPDKQFCLFFETDNPNVAFRIRCYDSTKTLVSSLPATSLLKNSPTFSGTTSNSYGNTAYTRNTHWAIIVPNNPTIKYIDLTIGTANNTAAETATYKEIDVTLTSYAKLEDYVINGLSKEA